MTTENKKSYRFVLTKHYVVECYDRFKDSEEATDWVNESMSNGEFEDLAEDGYGIEEDWEVIEIDANGNVI